MNKNLYKRLLTIKSLIILQTYEGFNKQIESLKKFAVENSDIQSLVDLLEAKNMSGASLFIDELLKDNLDSDLFDTAETTSLKHYIKILNKKLIRLRNRKENMERAVLDFGIKYNFEIGSTIERILFLRKELLKCQFDAEPEDNETREEYEDAVGDFEKYHQEIEEIRKKNILSETQVKEIKTKYRKASKLCHPDIIDESMKDTANKIFGDLKDAYERNDLKEVDKILEMLENNNVLIKKSDIVDDKNLLVAEVNKLLLEIKNIEFDIYKIQRSETFKLIKSIKNIEEYIKQNKHKLQTELESLEEIYKDRELFYSRR